jgi:hypothetical protein
MGTFITEFGILRIFMLALWAFHSERPPSEQLREEKANG